MNTTAKPIQMTFAHALGSSLCEQGWTIKHEQGQPVLTVHDKYGTQVAHVVITDDGATAVDAGGLGYVRFNVPQVHRVSFAITALLTA